MNKPYKKEYNDQGLLMNPIEESFINKFPNRKSRRPKKERFFGNGKNFPLTVIGKFKFKRVRQIEKDKEGKRKVIEHYLPL